MIANRDIIVGEQVRRLHRYCVDYSCNKIKKLAAFTSLSLILPHLIDQQITISYGDRNNDDLLQYFGFVEVDCAFDRYVVLDPLSVLKSELTFQITDSENNKALTDLLKIVEIAMTGNGDEATLGYDTDAHLASLVVNRNGSESWDLGALKFLKGTDQFRCIGIILASEMRRLNLGLSDIPNQEAMPEFNPCIVRTFLTEKIKVLAVASALIV